MIPNARKSVLPLRIAELAAVLFAFCTALLSGCGSSNSSVVVGRLNTAPQMVLPNGNIIAWNLSPMYQKAELRELSGSSLRRIGQFESPGLWNRPVDNEHFISMAITGLDQPAKARRKSIYYYDLGRKTRRLLVADASIERILNPISPDAKQALVYLKNPTDSLASVSLKTGRATILLNNVWPLDATWSRDGKYVLCAVTNPRKSDSISVCRIRVDKHTSKTLWSRSFGAVSELHCSADNEHIAYISGNQLICESIDTGKKWIVFEDKANSIDDNNIDCMSWSHNGQRLAVLERNDNTHAILFNTASKRLSDIKMKGTKWPLDWLPDNRSFLFWSLQSGKYEVRRITDDGKGNIASSIRGCSRCDSQKETADKLAKLLKREPTEDEIRYAQASQSLACDDVAGFYENMEAAVKLAPKNSLYRFVLAKQYAK